MNKININSSSEDSRFFNEVPLKIKSEDVIVENTIIDDTTTPPTKIDNTNGAANYLNAQDLFENLQIQQNANTSNVAALKNVINVNASYDTSSQVNSKINDALVAGRVTFSANKAVYTQDDGTLKASDVVSRYDIEALRGIYDPENNHLSLINWLNEKADYRYSSSPSKVMITDGNGIVTPYDNGPSVSQLYAMRDLDTSSTLQTQINNKAQKSHAATTTEYGIGSSAAYGHLKIANNLSTSSFNENDPIALSAFQGFKLRNAIASFSLNKYLASGNVIDIPSGGVIIPRNGVGFFTPCWGEIDTDYYSSTGVNSFFIKRPGTYLFILQANLRPDHSENGYSIPVTATTGGETYPYEISSTNIAKIYNYIAQQLTIRVGVELDMYTNGDFTPVRENFMTLSGAGGQDKGVAIATYYVTDANSRFQLKFFSNNPFGDTSTNAATKIIPGGGLTIIHLDEA